MSLRRLVASLALPICLAGCWVEPDPRPAPEPAPVPAPAPAPSTSPNPMTVAIQTGQTLSSEPGQGAGVFVEYLGEGNWYVWSTCDSAVRPWQCHYELFATPEQGAKITAASQDPADQNGTNVLESSASRLHATFVTSYEIDGFSIQVDPPGAALELELWTDGQPDPKLFYWPGPDVVHYGAPTDPVVFAPTGP